ncbi:MAG: leucyl aminopeptidase family protein [Phycisphaerales bacterium]|nr:leucyl aminopeptidase family protein [Phycisphaerales bacterium]
MLSSVSLVKGDGQRRQGGRKGGATEVVVVGMFQGSKAEAALRVGAPYRRAVAVGAERPECTGEPGRTVEVFTPAGGRVWVVGLGKREKFKVSSLRSVGASVARRLAGIKGGRARFELRSALESAGMGGERDRFSAGRCIGEAFSLLSWDNLGFKGKGTPADKRERHPAELAFDDGAMGEGAALGIEIGAAANLTRTLSETPPNVATPEFMARAARDMARACGLVVEVFEGKDLERERLAGHVNVGKASENLPCMIRLVYTPRGRRKGGERPLVLIGKTMTYDTGGLSLKVNNGMVGMKRDKDGGCAVLGAMRLCARVIKPDYPVVAYLCAAENSVSSNAYRPDDVITYRNGVTVEVTNTDAEGRLVLADALCYACETDNPSAIIELSTLTGGVITALGSTYAGLFCDDDALRARVERASESSGERVWRLPTHQEYRDMMKSPVADILNSNPNRKAHAGQGAAFLSYFVKEGVPFCHLDIAGVHVAESDSGLYVKGSSGFGVRLLADVLSQGD